MTRTVSLDWDAFMGGKVKSKERGQLAGIVVKSLVGGHLFFIPTKALAASGAAAVAANASWAKILSALLTIADFTCVGVIMFCGALWMFGHRTRAIELLISSAIGYIIIRHATDIRDWLRGI